VRDRDRTIEELNQRLRALEGFLREVQATNKSLSRRFSRPTPQLSARQTQAKRLKKRALATQILKKGVRRSRVHPQSAKAKKLKQRGRRR
jgi:hypothetical protein